MTARSFFGTSGLIYEMKLHDALSVGFAHLTENRLRSGLSILGIFIGIASVLCMMAIGDGAKLLIEKDIEKLGGANQVHFRTRTSIWKRGRLVKITTERFTLSDVDAIVSECPDVLFVLPKNESYRVTITSQQGGLSRTYVEGVTADYAEGMHWDVQYGRFLTREEIDTAAQVCVLGAEAAIDLFGTLAAVMVETADVLKDFMMAPTQMGMQMHMLGAMFAPHDKITLMAMTSYQQRHMVMQGAHHHKEGHHLHPVGSHEMSSAGIGDTKLEALLTLWKKPDLTLLGNMGVSLPTGSIGQTGENAQLLPYSMQLGTGSFQAHPGLTIFGYHSNWSYGSQLRGGFPLHSNGSYYRHGNTFAATVWGARRINDWLSLSGRLLFSHDGDMQGRHPDLNLKLSPSHRSDFRSGTTVAIAFSSNLMVATGSLAGHRLAVEWMLPVYQNLSGIQLKNRWRLLLGWQYALHL